MRTPRQHRTTARTATLEIRWLLAAGLLLLLSGALIWLQGCSGCYCYDDAPCTIAVPAPVDDGNEPPVNPYLADSPWPMSHRNPYCQASSPFPGPLAPPAAGQPDFIDGAPALITLAFSGLYPDGSRVMWGSNQLEVFKASPCPSGCYYQVLAKEDVDLFNVDEAISGAYTVVDHEGTFFVPRFQRILAYGDETPGDPLSPIVQKGFYEIPEGLLHGADDLIVGLNLTCSVQERMS